MFQTAIPKTTAVDYNLFTNEQLAEHIKDVPASAVAGLADIQKQAWQYIESHLNMAVVPSTREITTTITNWPKIAIADNIRSITSLHYIAQNDTDYTEMDAALYVSKVDAMPPRIHFIDPIPTIDDRPDAVKIVYDAGYENLEAIPGQLVRAFKMLVAEFYEYPDNPARMKKTAVDLILENERKLWV